jgi:agmatine/peptidylarginine deiminase
MKNTSLKYLTIILCLFLVACKTNNKQSDLKSTSINHFDQGDKHRTAAEWEPALGTMITWPLCVPYKLAVALSQDNHLYTLVNDETTQKDAEKWYKEWGIDLENVSFLYAEQGIDAWWTRDWGPSAVFDGDHNFFLADGKYIYATPATDLACNDSLRFLYYDDDKTMQLTQIDDDATIPLAKQLGFELIDLPFNNTGGNVLSDGLGTAISSCVITSENKYYGVDKDDFFKLNDSLLGFKNYHIISNFEHYGIQHVDCFFKIIDEETLLVAEPPKDHDLYDIYNNIVDNELATLKTPYGRDYKIKRLATARYDGERLAAYTNSLILNNNIYVPLFDIDQDSLALETWKEAMPGYQVKGYEFYLDDEPLVSDKLREHYRTYGWNSGDALHCRTRAVWDPDMLFMSIKKVKEEVVSTDRKIVYSTIIDYSDQGLIEDSEILSWRIKGESEWKQTPLTQDKSEIHYYGEINHTESGDTIEYFITSASRSGRKESRPKTAPNGFYSFTIK